ncbi:MAG: hypothetical protein U0U67_17275 [Chitinophagales bacterium]
MKNPIYLTLFLLFSLNSIAQDCGYFDPVAHTRYAFNRDKNNIVTLKVYKQITEKKGYYITKSGTKYYLNSEDTIVAKLKTDVTEFNCISCSTATVNIPNDGTVFPRKTITDGINSLDTFILICPTPVGAAARAINTYKVSGDFNAVRFVSKDSVYVAPAKETTDAFPLKDDISFDEFSLRMDYYFSQLGETSTANSSVKAEIFSCLKQAKLKQELIDAENEKYNEELGALTISKKEIKIFKKNPDSEEPLTIKEVKADIVDGFVYDVQIIDSSDNSYTTRRIFTLKDMNTCKTIKCYKELVGKGKRKAKNVIKQPMIVLTDVLKYNRKSGSLFRPMNTGIDLIANDPEKSKLKIGQSLAPSQVFQVAAYTDILALANKQNNGIFELEVSSLQRPTSRALGKSNVILFHTLRERFIYRKFSEPNSELNLDERFAFQSSTTKSDTVRNTTEHEYNNRYSILDLRQRSFLSADLTVGLVNYRWFGYRIKEPHKGYLNFISGLNLVNIRSTFVDSTYKNTLYKIDTFSIARNPVVVYNFGLQLGSIFYFGRGFHWQFNYNIEWQVPFNFIQNDRDLLKYNLAKKFTCIQSLENRIQYQIPGQNHSYLFGKFIFSKEITDIKHPTKYLTYQLAVGYNLDIADLFSNIKK